MLFWNVVPKFAIVASISISTPGVKNPFLRGLSIDITPTSIFFIPIRYAFPFSFEFIGAPTTPI